MATALQSSTEPPVVKPKPKRWSIAPLNTDLSIFLSERLRVHPVVGSLLVNRGVETTDAGTVYLDRRLLMLHDPAIHPGICDAADRIHAAVKAGRKICVYGDYDVDGMCASSILLQCLRLAGADPVFYIPDRFEEGYGVNCQALETLRAQGIDLVITVDCGITSVAEARRARELGLEYIVTDHHEMVDEIPGADVVVHPRLPGTSYPFGDLCGTGVAFKLAWEIARRFSGGQATSPAFKQFLLNAVSLAAIGTVCDIVPMAGENRVLVHHGLMSLKQSPPLGLHSLMDQAGLLKKNRLDSEDIAFMLGPRLNACGRLGQARLGVELLTTRDNARATELARYMDEQNKERQTIERRTFLEARQLADEVYQISERGLPASIVLASDHWHPGVVGIVASRMVERFHRPCILIAMKGDEGTGSARSIPGIHLQQALAATSSTLITCGGHQMAAGLRIRRERIEEFREALEAEIRARLNDQHLVADLAIDLEVPLHVLTPRLIRSLEVLEPFGAKNPRPLFLATGLVLKGEPRAMGTGGRHMSFQITQKETTMRAVAFGQAERMGDIADNQGQCCVVFEPLINEFRGFPQVELKVRDFRPGPCVEQV